MTHVEFPQVLILAHQILQFLLEIQPGNRTHRLRGCGLRRPPPDLAHTGVFMHRHQGAGLCSSRCQAPLPPRPSKLQLSQASIPTPSITPSVLTAHPAPTPWEAASTSAASVCSSLARSGSPGQRCALCTPAAWFASWQEARQSPCFLHNLSLGRAWGGAPISFS